MKRMNFDNYCHQHFTCALASLREFRQTLGNHLITLVVIAIALALPACLLILLTNLGNVLSEWDNQNEMSLFMDTQARETQTLSIVQTLKTDKQIASVHVIDREEALNSLDAITGYGKILQELPDNPLPDVITIIPKENLDSTQLDALKERLSKLPQVESVQFDLDWLQRLSAYALLGKRIVLLIGALLIVSCITTVSNTIRLIIQNHQAEIDIIKLVGATNGFIRRPYLYTGLWLGLIGGTVACLIVGSSLWIISIPINHLINLYDSDFVFNAMQASTALFIICTGIVLNIAAAWTAVHQYLRVSDAHLFDHG